MNQFACAGGLAQRALVRRRRLGEHRRRSFARHGERAGRLGDTSAAARLPRTFLAIAETDLLDTRRISRTSACGLTAP
jgi:hypothetical protein